jgi:protein-disulfide isomerase
MSEEKEEKHEHHEHHHEESKTITIKRDSLWKGAVFVLLVLLVISMFTGGFGIGGNGSVTTNNNNANTNTGTNSNSNTATGDTSVITANSNLYPELGPANAAHTVIEMADFQCPYCALASGLPNWTTQYASQYGDLIGSAKQMETLAQQGKIRFIFVPLAFLGQESTYAAQAAFCAENQNKFWDMHDAIYAASDGPSEDTGKYSIANLEKIASGVSGLNQAKFKSCLENNETLAQVNQAMSDVQKAGFQIATPQFFVDGKSVSASTSALTAAIGQ